MRALLLKLTRFMLRHFATNYIRRKLALSWFIHIILDETREKQLLMTKARTALNLSRSDLAIEYTGMVVRWMIGRDNAVVTDIHRLADKDAFAFTANCCTRVKNDFVNTLPESLRYGSNAAMFRDVGIMLQLIFGNQSKVINL